MSATTGTPELVTWLSQLKNPTEIRDSAGALIGVFVPQKGEADQLKALFDWDEVKRIAATERTGRPLQDILRDLNNAR